MDRVVDAFYRAHAWRSSHQFLGRYSVDKLQQFDQYKRETPFERVVAVIALSVAPTFVVSLALRSIEMMDANSSSHQSVAISVQTALSHAAVGMAMTLAARQALGISSVESPSYNVLVVGLVIGIVSGACRLTLLEVWQAGFVPTCELLVAILGYTMFLVANYALMRRTLRRRWSKVRAFMILGATQAAIVFAFVFVSLTFQFTSYGGQVALILVHPALRVAATKLVWLYARKLSDLTTDVMICFSEIAGTLCQTTCLLTSKGPGLSFLLVIMEIAQASVDVWIYVTREYVVDGMSTLRTSIKIIEGAQGAEEFDLDEFEVGKVQRKNSRDGSHAGSSQTLSSTALKTQTIATAASLSQLSRSHSDALGDAPRKSGNSAIASTGIPMKLRRSSSDSMKNVTEDPNSTIKKVSKRGSRTGRSRSPRQSPVDRRSAWKAKTHARYSSSLFLRASASVSITAIHCDTASAAAKDKTSNDNHSVEPAVAVNQPKIPQRRSSAHAAVVYAPAKPVEFKGATASPGTDSANPRTRRRSTSVFLTPRLFQDRGTKRLMDLNSAPTISAVPTPSGYQSVRPLMATRPSQVRIDGLSVTRKDQARILEQTLQLMFSFEALLVVQFIRVIVPVILGASLS